MKYHVWIGLCFFGVALCVGYMLWFFDLGLSPKQIIIPSVLVVIFVGLAGHLKYKADKKDEEDKKNI